ncbi:hypothetical protein CWB99_08260 [Pseudoalteromonas rubra]|uniref:Uncharacterized protein n=1 Tax=Pseudoalteromonas rubra TaxID=43658 RepID=A0A5S3WQB0_9GAMM|nr:hypothetical protein [Pseudoalteromonas rubra]TMP29588.1 hypothetical protein CWB99_08260 [Pseudoalteromonas rubra]TMP35181.1 hypothetical protein CWC00_05225 [Pseudoalteromonas rubra]
MSEHFRVVFSGFKPGTDNQAAIEQLAAKLKVSEQKVTDFTSGKPLFGPADKQKCLKQAKLLAIYGIQSKLQSQASAGTGVAQDAANERVFDALDYITSSLIRIEEKLDELEQRIDGKQVQNEQSEDDEWEDESLFSELELDSEPPKRSKKLLYILLSLLVLLLVVLGISLAFPELVPM